MAQDNTPAIVMYKGAQEDGYSIPFDKGFYGEVKVAFVRRGLTDYEYNPTTYSVDGELYAWEISTGIYYYTKSATPIDGALVYDAGNHEISGVVVVSTQNASASFSDGNTGIRSNKKDIHSHALLFWTGEPLGDDDWICIVRETVKKQPYSYPNNQKHIEGALDNLSRQVQELKAQSDVSLKVDPTFVQDPQKMNPIDWLNTIVRSTDTTARGLRYRNFWLEYSTDDPNKAEGDKSWTKLLNTTNITSVREWYDEDNKVYIPQYSMDGGATWKQLGAIHLIEDLQEQIDEIKENVYTKAQVDGKLAVIDSQIDANADAILKTREDFANSDQAIRDDMNAEDSRLQTQITAQAAAITTNKNDIDELGDDVAEIQAKIPESASGTNHLITKQQLLDEEMDIREDMNQSDSELQSQITAQAAAIATLDSEKLDKNQGSINAGKILTVGDDGLVVPSAGGTGGGLQAVSHDNTLSGAGTDESPLGLSEAIKDEISNKLDKEYASDFRGEWSNYASVPSDSNAYPADTLGSHIPNFNDYIIVKDSSDYFVASSKNLLEADVVGATIQSTPAAKFIVNYDVWYLGVAYNGYMGSNVPLDTFHSGVGTISFISNSADSYGVCRFVRLKPNTTYTISAKNGGRCAIASLTDEGGGYSKFSTHIKTPTSLPITFTTNDNSTYGIVLYANSHGTECTFEEIQLEIGSVATSYEVSGGYYLEGTWRFKYAGAWDANNKAGWTPEYRLDIDISHINNESIQTKDLTVGTGEGTINIGIVAGTATIATNNGLDIVAQTKFDTAPTTDDNTTWANALDTSLVRKAQVAAAISSFEALPDQTGNAGKFLKTDGSKASWEKVPQAGTKVIIRRGI